MTDVVKFYKKLIVPLAKQTPKATTVTIERWGIFSNAPSNVVDAEIAAEQIYNMLNQAGRKKILVKDLGWSIKYICKIKAIAFSDHSTETFSLDQDHVIKYLAFYYDNMNFRLDDITWFYGADIHHTDTLPGILKTRGLLASQQDRYNGIVIEKGAVDHLLSTHTACYYIQAKLASAGKRHVIGIWPKEYDVSFKDNEWATASFSLIEYNANNKKFSDEYLSIFWTTADKAHEVIEKYFNKNDYEVKAYNGGGTCALTVAINNDGYTAYVGKDAFKKRLGRESE